MLGLAVFIYSKKEKLACETGGPYQPGMNLGNKKGLKGEEVFSFAIQTRCQG